MMGCMKQTTLYPCTEYASRESGIVQAPSRQEICTYMEDDGSMGGKEL